jgi:hypothetical protein
MATVAVLRIKDWSEHFENNRTREIKNLAFVCIPNKLDGDGYTELIDHPAGISHYGAWITLCHVASRCDPRGTLLRVGKKPHDSRSLGRITRVPCEVYDEAIPRLIAVGWLEFITIEVDSTYVESHESAGIPHESAGIPHEGALNRTEQNRTERKGRDTPIAPKGANGYASCFELWWEQYPKEHRTGKQAAYRSYQKAGKVLVGRGMSKDQAAEFLRVKAIEFSNSPKGHSKYVPAPSVWLNQGRYDDSAEAWNRSDDTDEPQKHIWTDEELKILGVTNEGE